MHNLKCIYILWIVHFQNVLDTKIRSGMHNV